ncbi:MAG: hypothetical protein ACI8UO_006280, partial [Verrucomicrobiales bacterium]
KRADLEIRSDWHAAPEPRLITESSSGKSSRSSEISTDKSNLA